MSRYTDIAAYKMAVRVRSHKTVLVEGVTDKQVISSFFLTHKIGSGVLASYYVDDVSMISDAGFSGLGNKQKALVVASQMQDNKHKLTCLIDREWDGVDFQDLANSVSFPHADVLITKGHSIENYWFHSEALTGFLIQAYSDKISLGYVDEVSRVFYEILKFSAAYSLAAKDAGIITRSNELISSADVQWAGGGFLLSGSINTKLASREVFLDLSMLCNNKLRSLPTDNLEQLRWLCHGHLGEQAIRACAATLALSHGVDPVTISEIERGNKTGKFHHDISFINRHSPSSVPPLDELLAWINS